MNNFFIANSHFRVGLWLACMICLSSIIVLAPASSVEAQRRKSAFDKDKNKTEDKATDSNKKSAKTSTRPNARPRPGVKQNQKKDDFAPQNISLTVKGEGIQLAATWFPPILEDDKKKKKSANKSGADKEDAEPGKSIAPFILVHDWSRSRTDLLMLGRYLQSQGHAVIVPDLRGHGQSLIVTGATKPLDHTKFKKAEKASAVGDIDQCKRFLQEKNNEGIVNIDLLNIVAVGDSSHLAIAWALADWTWEPVAGIKQGKDVKSLILFSPTGKFAGSSLKKLVKDPMISGRSTTPLPMLVIWGGQSEAAEGCNSWLKLLRKFRPEAPEGDDLASRWFKQNLFHFQAPTGMKGYELAGNPSAQQIWAFANDFVSQKVVAYKDQFPWQLRGTKEVLKAREQEEE
jgi:pimeloyl-ACP methyl ester carboxylesterase